MTCRITTIKLQLAPIIPYSDFCVWLLARYECTPENMALTAVNMFFYATCTVMMRGLEIVVGRCL